MYMPSLPDAPTMQTLIDASPVRPRRNYDWAGPRFSRGLAPRYEPGVPEPHAIRYWQPEPNCWWIRQVCAPSTHRSIDRLSASAFVEVVEKGTTRRLPNHHRMGFSTPSSG